MLGVQEGGCPVVEGGLEFFAVGGGEAKEWAGGDGASAELVGGAVDAVGADAHFFSCDLVGDAGEEIVVALEEGVAFAGAFVVFGAPLEPGVTVGRSLFEGDADLCLGGDEGAYLVEGIGDGEVGEALGEGKGEFQPFRSDGDHGEEK